jgi:hypothetical protein
MVITMTRHTCKTNNHISVQKKGQMRTTQSR